MFKAQPVSREINRCFDTFLDFMILISFYTNLSFFPSLKTTALVMITFQSCRGLICKIYLEGYRLACNFVSSRALVALADTRRKCLPHLKLRKPLGHRKIREELPYHRGCAAGAIKTGSPRCSIVKCTTAQMMMTGKRGRLMCARMCDTLRE